MSRGLSVYQCFLLRLQRQLQPRLRLSCVHSSSSLSLSLCVMRFVYFRLSGCAWHCLLHVCVCVCVSSIPNWPLATLPLLWPPVFNCTLRSNRICALFSAVNPKYTAHSECISVYICVPVCVCCSANEISVLYSPFFARILMSV